MKTLDIKVWILALMAALPLVSSPGIAAAEVKSSYLYNLSNFTGTIPYSNARSLADRERDEIYVVEGNVARIFNSTGMEIYSFQFEEDQGMIYDVAVDEEGSIFTLSLSSNLGRSIQKRDFRGTLIAKISLSQFPPAHSGISPTRMVYRNGLFYLVSMDQLRAVVVDKSGVFVNGYDFAELLGVKEEERTNNKIRGFNLDYEGNMLFTIPVQFQAFKVSPDGKVSSFGRKGSSRGKFGVVTGIAADGNGNYLVADILRCVVMVFDKDFRFQTEFGYRGFRQGNLIGPRDLAVDKHNRVYVTQLRKRGVSVFQLVY